MNIKTVPGLKEAQGNKTDYPIILHLLKQQSSSFLMARIWFIVDLGQ